MHIWNKIYIKRTEILGLEFLSFLELFLSKEDIEDNLMRVVSGDIAVEIMEMTFGGEKELMDW